MRGHVRDERGSNAVEFALILPILIVLLFGTMYGSSLYNSQQTLNQAAREGARFGATLPITGFGHLTAPPPAGSPWYGEVLDRVEGIVAVDSPLASSPPILCVRFYPETGLPVAVTRPSTATCPAATAGGLQGPRVEVFATRASRLELGMGSLGPIDLRGRGVARYEETLDAP